MLPLSPHSPPPPLNTLLRALRCPSFPPLQIALLGEMMRWPSEWGPLSRELYSGTNAVGPILFSHDVIAGTFMFGPMLMVSVAYWMMGRSSTPHMSHTVTPIQPGSSTSLDWVSFSSRSVLVNPHHRLLFSLPSPCPQAWTPTRGPSSSSWACTRRATWPPRPSACWWRPSTAASPSP